MGYPQWRRNTPSEKASSIEIHSLLSELIMKRRWKKKIGSLGGNLQSRQERKKWDEENQPGENQNSQDEWRTNISENFIHGKANVHVSIHIYISHCPWSNTVKKKK